MGMVFALLWEAAYDVYFASLFLLGILAFLPFLFYPIPSDLFFPFACRFLLFFTPLSCWCVSTFYCILFIWSYSQYHRSTTNFFPSITPPHPSTHTHINTHLHTHIHKHTLTCSHTHTHTHTCALSEYIRCQGIVARDGQLHIASVAPATRWLLRTLNQLSIKDVNLFLLLTTKLKYTANLSEVHDLLHSILSALKGFYHSPIKLYPSIAFQWLCRDLAPRLGLKDGWKDALTSLASSGVPTFVFSSGHGDVISQVWYRVCTYVCMCIYVRVYVCFLNAHTHHRINVWMYTFW